MLYPPGLFYPTKLAEKRVGLGDRDCRTNEVNRKSSPMLTINPLLQLTPLRTQRGVARLAEIIWGNPQPVRVEATATRPDHISLTLAKKLPRKPVLAGESWGQLYDQRWCRVKIPAGLPVAPIRAFWMSAAVATPCSISCKASLALTSSRSSTLILSEVFVRSIVGLP